MNTVGLGKQLLRHFVQGRAFRVSCSESGERDFLLKEFPGFTLYYPFFSVND